MMARACIGLGANTGNRAANLRMALRAVTRLARVVAVSSLFETEPVGKPQPRFYNAACLLETGLDPLPLLRFLQGIEHEVGRRPAADPGGPRPLDLDILLYGEETVDLPGLVIPHPRLAERSFVLAPLAEIAGDERHPVTGRTISEMAQETGIAGVTLISPRGWDGVAGSEPEPVRI